MKRFIFLLAVCLALLFLSCNREKHEGEYFLQASGLTNQLSPDQVSNFMGSEPDSAFHRLIVGKKRFIQLYYAADSTEFRFKDNHLIEVIVHKPSLPWEPESITRLGLNYEPPTSEDTAAFYMWKDKFKGLNVVNFYLVGSKNHSDKPAYKIYLKLN